MGLALCSWLICLGDNLGAATHLNGETHQVAHEIGPEIHTGAIKSIVFTADNPNMFMTSAEEDASHGKIRWFDLRNASSPIAEHTIDGQIGSCELNFRSPTINAPQSPVQHSSDPEAAVLSVAAGKSVYFFSGFSNHANILLRRIDDIDRDTSCVALDISSRKIVTGCKDDTHVHIYDYDDREDHELGRGHHGESTGFVIGVKLSTDHRFIGPVWSTAFSPDGKLYATGSEDGTVKLWKWGTGDYGLWRGE